MASDNMYFAAADVALEEARSGGRPGHVKMETPGAEVKMETPGAIKMETPLAHHDKR